MWTKFKTWLTAEETDFHKYWMLPAGIALVALTWSGFIEYILHAVGTIGGIGLIVEFFMRLKSTPK